MSNTPKRYQFTNHLPASREPAPLPVQRPVPLPEQRQEQPQQVVVNHYHEAPTPDRTLQRVALGAGMGGGAVAAGVYFGPLLIAAITSMAISLAVVALVVVVTAWSVVTVVRSIGGTDGQAAAKTVRKGRRRRG